MKRALTLIAVEAGGAEEAVETDAAEGIINEKGQG